MISRGGRGWMGVTTIIIIMFAPSYHCIYIVPTLYPLALKFDNCCVDWALNLYNL